MIDCLNVLVASAESNPALLRVPAMSCTLIAIEPVVGEVWTNWKDATSALRVTAALVVGM